MEINKKNILPSFFKELIVTLYIVIKLIEQFVLFLQFHHFCRVPIQDYIIQSDNEVEWHQLYSAAMLLCIYNHSCIYIYMHTTSPMYMCVCENTKMGVDKLNEYDYCWQV